MTEKKILIESIERLLRRTDIHTIRIIYQFVLHIVK